MSNVEVKGPVIEGAPPPYTGGGTFPPPMMMMLLVIGGLSGLAAGGLAFLEHCSLGVSALATLSGLTSFAVLGLLRGVSREPLAARRR
jgi:hypothetical protein